MPSFKRREAGSDRRKMANGLRPSPYPSLVPLFSTGLASLDDVLSGSGLPSSCLLAICPALGLAGVASQEQNDEVTPPASTASGSDKTLEALKAAEQVALDLMSYSIAQGLVAGQETLVVGRHANGIAQDRMPAKATTRDYGQNQGQDEDAMKIAFRYAHRPKFKTTVDEPEAAASEVASTALPEEHLFRAPFDMSKRWTSEELSAAKTSEKGKLRCVDADSFDEAWNAIEQEAERCCMRAKMDKSNPPPALRIHLPSLGSHQTATGQEATTGRLVQLSRFLVRLRRLLKSLSLREEPIHSICILTISPDMLMPSVSMTRATLHIARFLDAQLLISDFSHHRHLAKAYLGYGGSISLLKGPSVGFLLPPGESRSVLRGGVAEAGAENDVGWKRRRRGVVLETLHEDVDAGVKDDAGKQAPEEGTTKRQGDDIEESAMGLLHARTTAPPEPATASVAKRPGPRVKFEGLKSLRERGLRATKPVNVEVEKTDDW